MPTSSTTSATSHSSRRRRGRTQNYTSLATNNQDDADDADDADIDENNSIIEEFQDEPASTDTTVTTTTTSTSKIPTTMKSLVDDDSDNEEDKEEKDKNENGEMITIIILDSAQKKFPIQCHPSWTVGKFKYQSSLIHKVHPKQQRLIFRGKMLTNDTQTLEQQHIIASDITVHLFPKPIIKITPTTTNTTNSGSGSGQGHSNTNVSTDNREAEDGNGGGGAHVPSIVIDQEEQDRRGQILVLGSVEIAESQNNVKMLSLLLVMICAMRLLSLFSIAMGGGEPLLIEDPDDGSGGTIHNHTAEHPQSSTTHTGIYDNDFLDDTVDLLESDNYEPRAWALSDYYDLLVSSIGFYVGTLGMKATQENTLQLATMYAIGTIIAGILWNVWNVYEYIEFFQEQQTLHEDHNTDSYENHHPQDNHYANHDPNHPPNNYPDNGEEELPPLTRDDFVTVAFFTILMPLCVWFLCCVRAFEFRRLISEAEDEASERIRNEYVEDTETDGNGAGSGNGGERNSTSNDGGDDDGDGTNSITEIV